MTYPLTPINTVSQPQFQPYTDEFGMITNSNQGITSGNGNLYTAYYIFGLHFNKLLPQEQERLVQVYKNNFMEPGLLCRSPQFPGSRQTQDDYFGVVLADSFLNPETRDFTKQIFAYAQAGKCSGIDAQDTQNATWNKILYYPFKILGLGKVKYLFNNIAPGQFSLASWLGRFSNLSATLELASKRWPNPLQWIWWVSWILSSWVSNDNGGDLLRWCSCMGVEGRGFIANFVCKLFYKKIDKKYGSLSGLMASYFTDPANPLPAFLANIKYY
jgi:hypothetical protein